MRPTARTVVMLCFGLPIALLPAIGRPEWYPVWLGFVAAAVLLIAVDAILALSPRRLEVDVDVPKELAVGERHELAVNLSSRRTLPGRLEAVLDVGNGLDRPKREIASPKERRGKGGSQFPIPLRAPRRGQAELGDLHLRWSGPFGLISRHKRVPAARSLPVVTNIAPVRAMALRYFSKVDASIGLKVEQFMGDGSEFQALREYVPGFDPRSIDWKSSAHHRKLMCREFRAERNHQVVVAVDTGQLMCEPLAGLPKLDHAVTSALVLGYVSLKTGDRVGLYGFDAQPGLYAEPVGGVRAFGRLQRLSADLRYRTVETNFTLCLSQLATRLRRRSLIVLMTDFVDTIAAELMLENVRRLARRHLVLFVTLRDPTIEEVALARPRSLDQLHRSVVAEDFIRERDLVIERLRRMGVHCIDAEPRHIGPQLINRYLDIVRRELV